MSAAEKKSTVLVVDDSELDRELLGELLESHGYNVIAAPGGQEALAILADMCEQRDWSRIDLIILDVSMVTDNEGFEILATIKRDKAYRFIRHIPVVMASSHQGMDFVVRAIEHEAEDYLQKPVEEASLIARVNASVRKAHVTRRYQEVLYSIFPQEVAEQVIDGGSPDPIHFPSATVMFTDFMGFTKSADSMADRPGDLVLELDTCFSEFDRILESMNSWLPDEERGAPKLRKIHTIGDAYMACGGVPQQTRTHAVDAVLGALRIREFMRARRKERSARGELCWSTRIGMHTGPVTAGVLGREGFKYNYDLFGDTVNTASRMESSCDADEINISAATWEQVESFFTGRPRGRMEVKGKGEMEMFFVDGIRPELQEGANEEAPLALGPEFVKRYAALRGGS